MNGGGGMRMVGLHFGGVVAAIVEVEIEVEFEVEVEV